jgi:hypothetical protein
VSLNTIVNDTITTDLDVGIVTAVNLLVGIHVMCRDIWPRVLRRFKVIGFSAANACVYSERNVNPA